MLTVNSKAEKTENCDYDLSLLYNGGKINIERPKVIYNEKTGKFVMWMHYENGEDYSCARCAVATCDTPCGDFVYHGSFNPLGFMSRDCTLFIEGDKAYFISASNNNEDLHVYLLDETFLKPKKLINKLFVGESREAPCMIKVADKYFMFTSGCTGWAANRLAYSFCNQINGKWSENVFIANETTFDSQGAYVFVNNGKIIYLGDRWGGNEFVKTKKFDYFKSGYVQFEIKIEDKKAELINSENVVL